MPLVWTQRDAIDLCVIVESVCPDFGCHVALTGGLLYRNGMRSDCDLLFYRIRQRPEIDQGALFEKLKLMGFDTVKGFGWCFKTAYGGKPIDMFFPEEQGGEYGQPEN